MTDSSIRIIVAAHKQANVPTKGMYMPVHVGKVASDLELGFVGDDSGDNISNRNPFYCELTALYWAWKNTQSDAIGMNHYRRYFRGDQPGPAGKHILSDRQAAQLLKEYDFVIAKPRNYYIETVESHYRHAHVSSDLDRLRQIIKEVSPEYLGAFDATMKQTKLSLANMFLANREAFDQYANWLFPILDRLFIEVGTTGRSKEQSRYVGFAAERLLNVWVQQNQQRFKIGYVPIVNTEGENLFVKGVGLIKRKLRGSSN